MLTLRPYQTECIKALWKFWRTNSFGRPVLVLPTGSGKSLIQAEIINQVLAQRPAYRILVLSHRKEILEQNAHKIMKLLPYQVVSIYSSGLGSKNLGSLTVAGIQSIYKKDVDAFHLIIIDECFTGDTLISTPSGFMRIDLVRCGDYVYNACGIGRVEHISAKPTKKLLKIRFSDETEITCTPNHKFFTESGWLAAEKLDLGSIAFSPENMRMLWQNFQTLEKTKQGKQDESAAPSELVSAEVLLNILLEETGELHERSKDSIESEQIPEKDRTQTYSTLRERALAAFATISNPSRPGRWMGSRSCNSDSNGKRFGIPDLLQDRRSQSRKKDRNRDRRGIALSNKKTGNGCKKDSTIIFPRVVDISSIESESTRTVFNLQVSGHPSYFANGKLVHNCHLISNNQDSMYQKFLDRQLFKNKNLKIVGLTATPLRMDQGSLITSNSLFTDIAYDCDMSTLIHQNYLSNIISKANSVQIDFSTVRKTGGDFNQGELEQKMLPHVLENCQEIISKSSSRSHWLVFCSGIEHAKQISSQMNLLNIRSAYVTSEMMNLERDRILRDFKNGEIQCLCNCDILTTGFDFPGIDLIAILRATQSPGLYIQIVGRGMRTSENKKDCLILDFGGNISRFGPIDCIKVNQKKEKTKLEIAPHKMCPDCGLFVPISTKICLECGHQFPAHSMHVEKKPDESEPIISSPQEIIITKVNYRIHKKNGSPDSLRVDYYTDDLNFISDFLCFDHAHPYARGQAHKKWALLGGHKVINTYDAYDRVELLKKPSKLLVKKEDRFYRILQVLEWSESNKSESDELFESLNINI